MRFHSSLLTLFFISLAVICFGGPVHAAFITVLEPTDGPPTAETDLANAQTTLRPEFANVSGVLVGGDASSLTPGSAEGFTRFAVLTEPANDPFGPRISDIIRLEVSQLVTGGAAAFRQVSLDFFSDGFPGFGSIIPAGLIPPAVEETGDPQNITALFDINANALTITVSSDLATVETPEPTTLALLGLGIVGLGWASRRRAGSR